MIKAGTVAKGMFLAWQGEPVLVVGKEFSFLGRGSGMIKLKLKNLKTGKVVKEVLKTNRLVEEIEVEHQRFQFLYKNGNHFVFMNTRTYEQVEVEGKVIGDDQKFIKEGEGYGLLVWEKEVVGISLPKKIVFEVIKTEEAVKGDTVTGATKPATLDNGAVVKVPLFIKKGDKVTVSTETGTYLSRA